MRTIHVLVLALLVGAIAACSDDSTTADSNGVPTDTTNGETGALDGRASDGGADGDAAGDGPPSDGPLPADQSVDAPAQPTHRWVTTWGNADPNDAWAMALDPSGSVIVASEFQKTVTVGTTTLTAGDNQFWDGLVVKLDAQTGAVQWVVHVKGAGAQRVRAVTTDQNGEVYIGGYISGNATVGSTALPGATGRHPFVARLAGATGNVVWAKSFAGSGGVNAMTFGDRLYIAGDFNVSVDINSTKLTGSLEDHFYAAINAADGSTAWANPLGGRTRFNEQIGYSVKGILWFAGRFTGTQTYGNDTFTASGDADMVLVSIRNNTGLIDSAIALTGDGGGEVRELRVGPGGDGAYVCGLFRGKDLSIGTTKLSKKSTAPNTFVSFVAGFKNDLSVSWAFGLEAPTLNGSGSVCSGMDFDGGGALWTWVNIRTSSQPLTLAGVALSGNALLSVNAQNGTITRALPLEGGSGNDIAFDSAGDLILGGTFSNTVMFGPETKTSGQQRDSYAWKIKLP